MKISERLVRGAELENLIKVTDENTRDISAWFNRLAVDARKAAYLLDECERELEAIIEDQKTGGGDDTYPIAKTLLAKLRAQEKANETR